MLSAMKTILRRCAVLAPLLAPLSLPAQGPHAPRDIASAPPAASAAFEVASVKGVPLEEIERGNRLFSTSTYPTARFFMHSASLNMLIGQAYGIDGHNIHNQPDWAEAQFYDVDATVADGRQLTREQMQPLLQDLFARRFHLSVHREQRAVSGFELVIAKSGAKLQPAKESARPKGMPSYFHAQLLPNEMDGWGISVETFAHVLSGPAGKPIVDRTGLTGAYDIKLTYAPPNNPNTDSPLPDIFTAIQDQLGLKLIPAKVPVDYLIIDHVDRVPTDN